MTTPEKYIYLGVSDVWLRVGHGRRLELYQCRGCSSIVEGEAGKRGHDVWHSMLDHLIATTREAAGL